MKSKQTKKKSRNVRRMLGFVLSMALILESAGMQVLAEEVSAGDVWPEVSTGDAGLEASAGDAQSAMPDAEVEAETSSEGVSEEETDVVSGNDAKNQEDGVPASTEGSVMEAGEGLIASGKVCGLEWSVSTEGELLIAGTYSRTGTPGTPWRSYTADIKSARVTAQGVTSTASWFYGLINLESVDFSAFDTSKVTDMSMMFYDCESLTSLDLSGFKTGSVTYMSSAFQGCSSLTSLDLSGFDTSSVTSMNCMFWGCSSLMSLDLSGFDTSSVTDIFCMFSDCSSLTGLDLSSFKTGSVTDMSSMFSGCSGLTSLDLSGFETGSVTRMEQMFYGCSGLTSLGLSGFDTSNVTDMSRMFQGCSSLTDLDLSSFDTSSVTNMYGMFSDCSSLTSLNLSNFKTGSVTDMGSMFSGCNGLTSLDLSGIDMSQVTSAYNFLYGCSRLYRLQTPKNVSITVNLPHDMYDAEKTSYSSLPMNREESIELTGDSVSEGDVIASGTANGIHWSIDADGLLLLEGECNGKIESYGWKQYSPFIKQAKVTVTGATDASSMFDGCDNLTSVDLSGFKTGSVKSMRNMFYGCSSLTSLDLSGFDTGSVTDMVQMFDGCSSLTSLNLSGFQTGGVTSMTNMFHGCSGLTSLDLSGFDTGSVTNMYGMFYGCSGLTSLDLSGFQTGGVTSMTNMFHGCSSLTGLNLSSFETGSVTDMSYMFYYSSSLTSLDLSGFDTSSVTNMGAMFGGCSSLTGLDLSSFDTGSVTDMGWMFNGCKRLESVNLSSFDTGSVTSMRAMFEGCYSLKRLDLGSFDAGKATDADRMLGQCYSLSWLRTPGNLSQSVTLPNTMYDAKGKAYTKLPVNQAKSVELWADKGGASGSARFEVAPIPDQTYTGKAVKPATTVTCDGILLVLGTDYTVTYKNNQKAAASTAAAAPTVVIKGKGNYTGTISAAFTILPREITADNTTISPMVYTADGKLKQAVPTVAVDGKKLTANKDYTVEFPDTAEGAYKEPGRYSAVIRGKDNYQGEMTASVVILAGNQIQASKLKVAAIPACTYEEETPAKPAPKVTYAGKELELGKDYEISYQNNDRAGKATLTITGLENTAEGGTYVYGSVTKTFTVKGTALSKAKFIYSETGTSTCKKTYTGSEIRPAITLKAGDRTLTEGKDYTVVYTQNTDAGKATVTVTGKGGYTGAVKKTFTILPASAEENAVQVAFTEGKAETAYVQSGAKPEVTVTVGGTVLTPGRDYTLSYKNNKKLAGAADGKKAPVVIVKGKGNYKFQKQVPFTITAKSLSDADITAVAPDSILGAKNLLSTPVVTDAAGKKLKVKKDYTIAGYTVNGAPYDGKTAVEAGTEVTVTIRAAENGSYTGETTATYRIAERDIAKAKTNKPQVRYSGNPTVLTEEMLKNNVLTVTYTDKATRQTETLVYGTDYEIVSYKNNTKKGTATVTIRGIGRYGGTKTVKFTIVGTSMN